MHELLLLDSIRESGTFQTLLEVTLFSHDSKKNWKYIEHVRMHNTFLGYTFNFQEFTGPMRNIRVESFKFHDISKV